MCTIIGAKAGIALLGINQPASEAARSVHFHWRFRAFPTPVISGHCFQPSRLSGLSPERDIAYRDTGPQRAGIESTYLDA
jgi:hypothetical protein